MHNFSFHPLGLFDDSYSSGHCPTWNQKTKTGCHACLDGKCYHEPVWGLLARVKGIRWRAQQNCSGKWLIHENDFITNVHWIGTCALRPISFDFSTNLMREISETLLRYGLYLNLILRTGWRTRIIHPRGKLKSHKSLYFSRARYQLQKIIMLCVW